MDPERLSPEAIRADFRDAERGWKAEGDRIRHLRHDLLAFHPRYRRFVLITWAIAALAVVGAGVWVALEGTQVIPLVVVLSVPLWLMRRREHRDMAASIEAELSPRFRGLERDQKAADDALALARRRFFQSCELSVTYPPDWKARRQQVLVRDSYHCSRCQWPVGAKRRSRELHVHHVVAISDGGTHALSNLITLCSLCHSKVDGKHRFVRKGPRPAARRRWY